MSCADLTPQCLPPQASLLFFPGTAGPAGPAGAPSVVPGPAGPAGDSPIGVYTGDYAGGGTYYDNAFRRDIVAYAGRFWIVDNAAKNGLATWGLPNVADWADFGASLVNIATGLALMGAQAMNVGLTVNAPGSVRSGNFVDGSAGWLLNGVGGLQSYQSVIAGLLSTSTPKFNLASVTRTMPAVGYAEFAIPAIADIAILINPLVTYVTDDALIFYGWLGGVNSYIENRFGNGAPLTQKFSVNLQGTGTNTSVGADLFYIQIYYRTRTNGGAWGAWIPIGDDAYMNKLAAVGQSFKNAQYLSVTLAGNQDVSFGAGFSKGAGGTVSLSGAHIAILAFN